MMPSSHKRMATVKFVRIYIVERPIVVAIISLGQLLKALIVEMVNGAKEALV